MDLKIASIVLAHDALLLTANRKDFEKVPGLRFIAPLTYPLSRAGLAAGIWVALGLIYLVWLYRRDPARVDATGRVFLDEPEPAPAAGSAAPEGSTV